jgi:hypothetical protein
LNFGRMLGCRAKKRVDVNDGFERGVEFFRGSIERVQKFPHNRRGACGLVEVAVAIREACPDRLVDVEHVCVRSRCSGCAGWRGR